MKERRDPEVQTWIEAASQQTLFFSAVTIGEIQYGIERLPVGARRKRLETWFSEFLIGTGLDRRILAFDTEIAMVWGMLRVREPNAPLVDSQIAATALAHGLTLVTRNIRDFAFAGLAVFNPWAN
jgi:predicted nucleic acid-binding protein